MPSTVIDEGPQRRVHRYLPLGRGGLDPGRRGRGIAAARLFVKSGTLTVRQTKTGKETIAAQPTDGAVTAPVVLLVDQLLQDAPGVRLMAEDSAILSGVEPRPTHRISFAYGYETTVRLVWDAPRQRFVRLWSCC